MFGNFPGSLDHDYYFIDNFFLQMVLQGVLNKKECRHYDKLEELKIKEELT